MLARFRFKNGTVLLNPWDIKYFWVSNNVLYDGDDLIGHVSIAHNLTYPSDTSVLMSLIANGEETQKKLLAKGLQDMHKMGDNKLRIHTGRWGFPNEKIFQEYVIDDFRVGLAYWEKEIK